MPGGTEKESLCKDGTFYFRGRGFFTSAGVLPRKKSQDSPPLPSYQRDPPPKEKKKGDRFREKTVSTFSIREPPLKGSLLPHPSVGGCRIVRSKGTMYALLQKKGVPLHKEVPSPPVGFKVKSGPSNPWGEQVPA